MQLFPCLNIQYFDLETAVPCYVYNGSLCLVVYPYKESNRLKVKIWVFNLMIIKTLAKTGMYINVKYLAKTMSGL